MNDPKVLKLGEDNDMIAIGVLVARIDGSGDAGERIFKAWEIVQELKGLGWECHFNRYP